MLMIPGRILCKTLRGRSMIWNNLQTKKKNKKKQKKSKKKKHRDGRYLHAGLIQHFTFDSAQYP